jgi:hypothetical protein
LAIREQTGGGAVGAREGAEKIVEGVILIDDENGVLNGAEVFGDRGADAATPPRMRSGRNEAGQEDDREPRWLIARRGPTDI